MMLAYRVNCVIPCGEEVAAVCLVGYILPIKNLTAHLIFAYIILCNIKVGCIG